MPPPVFRSVRDLAKFISEGGYIGAGIATGVDGFPGAGKSTLARELSSLLKIPVVGLDDFLERNRGGFLEFLDYGAIAATVDRHLTAGRGCIIEGCCLLEAAERAHLGLAGHVYVRRRQNNEPEDWWPEPDDIRETWPESETSINRVSVDYYDHRRPDQSALALYDRCD